MESSLILNTVPSTQIMLNVYHELEGSYRRIVGSAKVYLRVDVTPDEAHQPKIYMPSDKAKELMAENEEVRTLVKDLGLDIK